MSRLQRIALITFACLEVLIFFGAIVRATGSGLGCPDWPFCYGRLVPPTSADQIDFSKLDLEKFKKKAALAGEEASSITAETLRARFDPVETWIEYINRLTSIPLLAALVALMIAAFQQPRRDVRVAALFAFALFMSNAVLGALVVKSLLKPNNVTLHMALAILMLCVLVFTAWRGTGSPWRLGLASRGVVGVGVALFVLVVIEGILGSQVREMTDTLAKTHAGQPRSVWVTELEHSWVYLVHRSFSWLVLGLGIGFLVSARAALGRIGWLEKGIFALVCGQMILGVVLSQIGIVAVAQILHIGISSLLVSGLFLWLLGSTRTSAAVR